MSVEAIEKALVERITAKLKDTGLLAYVYTAGEYAAMTEESQLHPAAAVIYNGYRVGDEVGNGVQQSVFFDYLVVLITRNAQGFAQGVGAQDDVSPIYDALLPAIIGWRPQVPGAVFPSPFRLSDSVGAAISAQGFAYWPVAFTIRRDYRGQP